MSSTDSDYLNAIARVLIDNDTLYNMVDGQIFTDFPEESVLDALDKTYQTVVGISYAEERAFGSWGYDTHHIQDTSVIIQIDVASIRGNNAAYCRSVCTEIKDLLIGDIDTTLNSTDYDIYISDATTRVYWDENIKCWHGVVSLNGQYWRVDN